MMCLLLARIFCFHAAMTTYFCGPKFDAKRISKTLAIVCPTFKTFVAPFLRNVYFSFHTYGFMPQNQDGME